MKNFIKPIFVVESTREELDVAKIKLKHLHDDIENEKKMTNSLFIELERCRSEKAEYIKRFGALMREQLSGGIITASILGISG